MNISKTIFIWIFLIIPSGLFAQKNIIHQSLFWTRYYNQFKITKNLTWHNEIDNRRFFDKAIQHHFIAHSRVHYSFFTNADIAFGITCSLQSPHDPESSIRLVVPEIRPNQEINLSTPLTPKLTLQHRMRIDERFIHKNDGKQLLEGYDFNVRLRYKIQANYAFSSTILFKLADELMINSGEKIVYNYFDQNRLYTAIEQKFNKNFSAELGYMHWFQQRPAGNQFFVRDILRFTLYHKMSRKGL